MGDKKERLSAAIIGTGRIAGGYDQDKFSGESGVFSHAGAYKKSCKINLKTVYDMDVKKASSFKNYWKAESQAGSLESVCSQFHDVISVCTPDETHYNILMALIDSRCCKTIFVEKPIASTQHEIKKIIETAREASIRIVVNFQRNFDKSHHEVKNKIRKKPEKLLTVNAYYIRGLFHIGTTMIDTLTSICGYPQKVLAYNRIWNQEINEYTYEFIMFYEDFNITVKTVDSNLYKYTYHIFEIDFLFSDERIIINDNSRRIEKKSITNYAYGDVKVLNDKHSFSEKTEYEISMLKAVDYVCRITRGQIEHTVNTPEISYNNKNVTDKIVESFQKNKKIHIKESEWIQ